MKLEFVPILEVAKKFYQVPLDSKTKLLGPSAVREALARESDFAQLQTLLRNPRVGDNILPNADVLKRRSPLPMELRRSRLQFQINKKPFNHKGDKGSQRFKTFCSSFV